jgi:hypothetical protein
MRGLANPRAHLFRRDHNPKTLSPTKLDFSSIDRMISECVEEMECKRAEIRASYFDFDASMKLARELDQITTTHDELLRYREQLKSGHQRLETGPQISRQKPNC